jgi:hypothetical protein
MSDFKIADGLIESIVYDAPVEVTSTGVTFEDVPVGRFFLTAKVWAAGGGGGGGGEEASVDGGDGAGGGFVWTRDVPVYPGETLLVNVGTGGAGGVGLVSAGVSGDGGAGGGRSYVFSQDESDLYALAGAGGGGGGASGNVGLDDGGDGGGGGGTMGQPGFAPPDALTTTGGGGGGQVAGGAGGAGTLSGTAGASLTGGGGADGSGGPIGANATGGSPDGGDGGAYDTDAPGGGGGGDGFFGGGGGGSGDTSPTESAGGGGGGSSFYVGTLEQSLQGDGRSSGGKFDDDYPGSSVGAGGLRNIGGSDSGLAGGDGAVYLFFGVTTYTPTVNDLVIEAGAPVMVDGIDLIAQQVRAILLICQGEWFLDKAAGTPWFTRIIGHKFNAGQLNITVRDAILSVEGVASLTDLVSVRGSVPRTANVRVTVLTTQGEQVIVNAEVP